MKFSLGLWVSLSVAQVGCGGPARLPIAAGFGEHPELPQPRHSVFPTVNIAKAEGWPAGMHPMAADGLAVAAFASGLDHPRWVYVLPNGDVLVAETGGPRRPEDGKGLKGHFSKRGRRRRVRRCLRRTGLRCCGTRMGTG